ncbi:hypothetical protein [Belliella aquatica]|uniref:Uncharacterized protein n=1 Tax=Belliella aquatica TaxID=1323734 RepID=A0ABQ1MHW2_9BACT|nr:hypothetical protein [Belliella aquatica]MCH7405502.1 hypothetical protein [Belliella aquatica]GGC41060.1 hypothetical protein GCM10010993_19660 [Belliella aquatica]
MAVFYRELLLVLFMFLGLSAFGQQSLELKKSVVFEQEPIDYYLGVDSAYFDVPHYVLWVDPIDKRIVDFNIHIPIAPVSKGSFYIEEALSAYGAYVLLAIPKISPERISYAHVDILPASTDLQQVWRKQVETTNPTWNITTQEVAFQFAPNTKQPQEIKSGELSARLQEDNWELSMANPVPTEGITVQIMTKDSVIFQANGTQQNMKIPARMLPPGKLKIKIHAEETELTELAIYNPLIAIREADISMKALNDSLAQVTLSRMINPWVTMSNVSVKLSITDFPELVAEMGHTGDIAHGELGFDEQTIAVFHSHQNGKKKGGQKIVVFNRENEIYYTSDSDGNYLFDQFDFSILDDDYHVVSHDDFQGKVDVSVAYPDLEILKSTLPDLLAAIHARKLIEQGKPKFTFNMETTGILLDEVSVTANSKRASLLDEREKPNSVHYRNTDYICAYGVLNCKSHDSFIGFKPQELSFISKEGGFIKVTEESQLEIPLHLIVNESGSLRMKFRPSHGESTGWFTYPNTFLEVIESKEHIRNIQEHYFWEEQIFGFYSELISQAYGSLSLLYFSELELPKLYSNAYLVMELIHHPSGSRQQVVKKIETGTQAMN